MRYSRGLRSRLLVLLLVGALATLPLASLSPREARASISIAVTYDVLLGASNAIAVMTPLEQRAAWEDGRITTRTRLRVDRAVAGDLITGGEVWIKTRGGVVGNVGQLVSGEPVFGVGKPYLMFVHGTRSGTLEVAARGQGQFTIEVDARTSRRLLRSQTAEALVPPREAPPAPGARSPDAQPTGVLAADVLRDRELSDACGKLATEWRALHAR